MRLLAREAECEALDQLLADVRAGQSRAVVLRGEAGVGKTALLSYLTEHAQGFRIASAVGVESEMELAYSGLHQLCGPMLDLLEGLPPAQHDALATVFGVGEGPPPDRFLVGIAALSLFAEAAEQQPLVCVVDDAQWLDQASAQILGFVARRLLAERVALVGAARTAIGDGVLARLPELSVGALDETDARALLLENLIGPLDAVVCDQIVAESHGNPLALLEFPRTWSAAELAGGFRLPEGHPVAAKIEDGFSRRLRGLPPDTQLLVLAATAEPLGDPVLLHSAAKILEIDMKAADAAVDAGLLTVGRRVEFAHPLVRSSAYRSAAAEDRHRVHRALADATDPHNDPDRRAWHRARAASGPDEDVAADLERSAGRAQARGGVAAAAAFLQRAVELTEDTTQRSERAVAAAEASFQAGAFDAALQLATTADAGPLDAFQRARVNLLRGHIALVLGYGDDAAPLLLEAARQLEQLNLDLARQAYLTAYASAFSASHLGQRSVFLEICRAIEDLPAQPGTPDAIGLLLEGMARTHTDGRATAMPILKRAVRAVADMPREDVFRWGWMAPFSSHVTWDPDASSAIYERQVQIVREAGVLAELPVYAQSLALDKAWNGDLAGAALLVAESDAVAAATGSQLPPFAALRLAALRGREAEASPLIEATIEQGTARGQGLAVRMAQFAAAVLYNGLSRYEEAASAARQVTADNVDPYPQMWALSELVEAAARSGDTELARRAGDRLAEVTVPAGTDWALATEARSRALLVDGAAADDLYHEAIERFGRTRLRPELARAHLLCGEWLRREGRRVDAREQLRTAYETFFAIGMEAFAERARRELNATGEKVRKRSPETNDELTPQEEQIARLARDGFSNPEIGAQLFISARTVEWHLRKVFTKLVASTIPSSPVA
jgi:DNA-binding CsgD family transcriptional regulator/tetratricopeptide (TPR) repeat protein